MDSYDVVVIGTGAAGLVAALSSASEGASVGLFEKSDRVGGTTALSGGVIWVPNNHYAADAGVADDRERSLIYLRSLSNGSMREEMITAFVDNAPSMLDWLQAQTPLQLKLVTGYPDYHPEHPGGLPRGGRSLEPELISTTGLGAWVDHLVGAARRLYISEIPSGGGTGMIAERLMTQRAADDREGLGRGLIAALLLGCLQRGIEPRTEMRAIELIVEVGRVVGVRFDTPGGPLEVRARRGVVVATGGFEWDAALVRDFLRGPIRHPAGVASNTGDGLKMAMRVGAGLGGMSEAWWVPVVTPPGRLTQDGEQAAVLLLRERTVPGTIMVNRKGRRFTNEAANYNALGASFHIFDVSDFNYANIPAWLVFDHACADRYGCFGAAPGQPVPDWVTRAGSLAELAAKIDVDSVELGATVRRWNANARTVSDPDFGRGTSIYDGWCGDREFYGSAKATIGPLAQGPYYAAQVHASTLGTKGGPRTTIDGQVLDVDGRPIQGLYAAGNVMAAPTGMAYGGAGGTLGPAMVFGYLAGRAVVAQGALDPSGS